MRWRWWGRRGRGGGRVGEGGDVKRGVGVEEGGGCKLMGGGDWGGGLDLMVSTEDEKVMCKTLLSLGDGGIKTTAEDRGLLTARSIP